MSDQLTRWQRYQTEIIEKVDFFAIFESFGCQTKSNPSPSGWVSCCIPESLGGVDKNPSGAFNIRTGYWKDFRSGGKAISLYQFMVAIGKANNWHEAQKIIADQYNIKPPSITKEHPEHGVIWQDWNDVQAIAYCKIKKPITIEGLKLSGARMCSRYGIACFAWPIYNQHLQIVGWYFTPRSGQSFEGGAKSIAKKYPGAEAGFIGRPAVEWMCHHIGITTDNSNPAEDRVLYWCEGVPDMLAGYSKFPDGLFVSNPNGCQENLTPTQEEMCDNSNVTVILVADADVPGLSGAFKRSQELSDKTKWCKNYVMAPPYNVAEKHGKDFRDILTEVEISDMIKADEIHNNESILKKQNKIEEVKEIQKKAVEVEFKKKEDRITTAVNFLEKMGIHVVSRSANGTITLYSEEHNHIRDVRSLGFWKYEDAAVFGGYKFATTVKRKQEEVSGNGVDYQYFQDAIAMASSIVECNEYDKVGAGIWALKDEDNEPTGELLLVKRNRCYTVRGSTIERRRRPIFKNITADLSCKSDWFNEDILADMLPRAADPEWRLKVYEELQSYVSSWNWENKDMNILVSGLIMSTWIQTMFKWRPIITLVGESMAGKTMFMEMLNDLYIGSDCLSGNSTAAGVKQSIKKNGRPILLDEFDSGTEQRKLLQGFRVSSRGQDTLQGTPDQESKQYCIRHMPWLAGIFASSNRQADLNRMINLSLIECTKGKKIKIPSPSQARELGHKILAGVLATAGRAVDIASQIGSYKENSIIPARYRESYAVPYGSLAAFLNIPIETITEEMEEYLKHNVIPEIDEQETNNDQEDLLVEIMSTNIRLGNSGPRENATVAEILFSSEFSAFHDVLQTQGLGIIQPRHGNRRVAIACKHIVSPHGVLSKSKEWSGNPGVSQVLRRLKSPLDPLVEKQGVAGQVRHCITIDFKGLESWTRRKKLELVGSH